jgi:adenylate kinase family enzyme
MIRRICLFAGPGSGKSTLAAKIFAALKEQQIQVELINEYIKTWAYTGKVPKSYDQLYVFAKQLNSEDVILRHVPLLITDSPLLLNSAYPLHYQFR